MEGESVVSLGVWRVVIGLDPMDDDEDSLHNLERASMWCDMVLTVHI